MVTPNTAFYAGALMLAGALFSSLQSKQFALLHNERLSAGLNYLQWNMGTSKFETFLESADRHRRGARLATVEEWALRTPPKRKQWLQPQINAIKFAFLVGAYAPLFPLVGDFPTRSTSVRYA